MLIDYDLDALLVPSNRELRDSVSSAALNEMIDQDIRSIELSLDRILDVVAVRAQQQCDHHYDYRHDLKEEGSEEFAKFGTRIRYSERTLQLVWYKNVFSKGGRFFSQQLPRGKRLRYLQRTFGSASETESKLIEHIEDRYALIRDLSEALKRSRDSLAEIKRRATKLRESVY